ncbi:hypothetical protein FSP39_006790 [Pinctada imbricata]|uniref:RING-type domain-containing protein n=1 Tax=Pinctada imbricata TaxID=66713 RepID=A0AA89BU63_PINIB|nr:hypothetical protein FSP39_006790 [Pinctada imbricata]
MSDTCSVCQDVFDNPKFLHCGHTFCSKCIDAMIGSSKGPYKIKCPLCRKETRCHGRGTEDLMDNFFVTDKNYSTKIALCTECRSISKTKPCESCQTYLCGNCISLHIRTKCGGEWYGPGIECDETKIDEAEDPDDANSAQGVPVPSEAIQTKYSFELDGRMVVPNDHGCGVLNINLSIIACCNENEIITVPNGERVIVYNENGEEILRETLPIEASCISSSIAGHAILIQRGQYIVYKYDYGSLVPMFSAPSVSPKAISSLNNGKIVIVGLRLFHAGPRAMESSEATFCIYDYNGSFVYQLSTEIGENMFACPTSVCANLTNNDIFIGDEYKKQVVRFREDGAYVSLFEFPACHDSVTLEFINTSSLFPLSIAYSQKNDLLFASYLTTADNGIYILSESLCVLGLFTSSTYIGIPAGMCCDGRGRLCIGDRRDGIIRIFKLSRFINRI